MNGNNFIVPPQATSIGGVANDDERLEHTGEVTSDSAGATTISDNAVDNAALSDMPAATIKGRQTGAGDPEDLTPSDVRSILNVANGADVTPNASEIVAGKAEIATQSETDAGIDDTRIVTPQKLANYPFPGFTGYRFTSGRYYAGGKNLHTVDNRDNSHNFQSNILYAVPFPQWSDAARVFDRISIRNANSGGTSLAVLGIYDTHPTDFRPNNLILDAGVVSLATTSEKEIVISQSLECGQIYWLVLNMNVNRALRAWNIAERLGHLGISSPNGADFADMVTVGFAYTGTLPATFPTPVTYAQNSKPPLFFLRAQ